MLRKRPDGYHDIESIFLPIPWCDVLEIVKSNTNNLDKITWKNYGLEIRGGQKDNLISKAYNALNRDFSLPAIVVNLLKQIPMGAGMGGGSADGSYALKTLNELCGINLSETQLLNYASQLGADCSFFIHSKPAYVQGIGDKLSLINFEWPSKYIYVVCPPYHISTVQAYQNMKPSELSQSSLVELIDAPIGAWKDSISNDFELYAFNKFPEIANFKNKLYECGALYASMTGSGSAVYGFFNAKTDIELAKNYECRWIGLK